MFRPFTDCCRAAGNGRFSSERLPSISLFTGDLPPLVCGCGFVEQLVTQKAAVLVVDDNPLIVSLLSGLLPHDDYQVYSCANGKEAAELLEGHKVDVIVCDVMMPQMGGYELQDFVRQKPELAHIPFIFLTALGERDHVAKGKESGADDYVVKPFDPQELLSIIRGKVRRSKNLRSYSEQMYDSFRKRVIHTLSHEFRTPLVAINTGTELLLENEQFDKKRIRGLLEAIQRGGQRLERLVGDFMALQQIEAGLAKKLFETRATEISIESLFSSIRDHAQNVLLGSSFVLESTSFCDSGTVRVYEPHVMDIIGRFVSNAMKFSKDANTIELCAVPLEREVAFEVRDRGIGIDVSKIEEAIDVFGQINRDRLEQQGGGLGLAIASRYAVINGGRLEFDSRAQGGAVASLILPRAT